MLNKVLIVDLDAIDRPTLAMGRRQQHVAR
jgi:hypothetical protein